MSDTSTHIEDLPTSFGTLKPVGHVLMAVKTRSQADILSVALAEAGWPADTVSEFRPQETVEELAAMVGNASGLAGFGYEITLMRRYLELAREGHSWLLVKVDDDDHAERAAQLGRLYGASLAVHYRRFTVEELI